MKLPKGASISQPLSNLRENARYQIFVDTSCVSSGTKNNTLVKILDENGTEVFCEPTATKGAWTANKFEFTTGAKVTGNYTLVVSNETASDACTVYLDNLFVAEALSDADLIVSDLYWDNDPGYIAQVKPGTPLTFTVTVVNQGTEAVRANQSFDVDILVDAKKVQTFSYTGALEPGQLVIVTGTAPWTAVQGDHMITAHVNRTMRVLENNIDNNDLTYNLRVYNDTLVAPEGALKRGFSKLTFSDDFNSVDTIDTKASGDEGYHWYVTRQYGESDQLIGRDFSVENGVLTLHSIESAWAHSISTTDTRHTSGFVYNMGYLEARVRLPYTSKDLYKLDHGVRNPGIWAFSSETMWGAVPGFEGERSAAIETDWIEFKGTKYRNPATMEKECSFHTVLHHREDVDGDGKQDYWTSVGEEFYYSEGYVISGATADDMGDWHVLGWAWSENLVEMYIDGRLINVFRYSEDDFSSPKGSSKYSNVPVKEGDFSPLNTQYNNIILGAQDEFRMEVDYIRVWQYDGSVEGEVDVPTTEADVFIGGYMTNDDGSYVTEPTLENYEKILRGENAFSLLTSAEQDEVNRKLGFNYLELVVEIRDTIAMAETFVSYYACAEDGTPYTMVDATNYEWITSAMAEWDTLSEFAKAYVNQLVAEQSGMTFDEMLELAATYTPEESAPADDTDEETDTKRKTKTDLTWLWIVLCVVGGVVVIGGGLVVFLLFLKRKKSK